jgi:hypothetical protein
MKSTPFFKHNCNTCIFLGQAEINGQKIDYYYCGKSADEKGTILYREGDDEADYGSTPISHIGPLNYKAMLGFGLYLKYLGVNGANSKMSGHWFKDHQVVLSIPPKDSVDFYA